MVKVRQCKSPAVIGEVNSSEPRYVGKSAVAIVAVGNVPLVTAPRSIGTNEFVDRVPAVFVIGRGRKFCRRVADYLSPEKTRKINLLAAGNVSVRNMNVRMAVMVEIPRIRRPSPAAKFSARLGCDVAKLTVA